MKITIKRKSLAEQQSFFNELMPYLIHRDIEYCIEKDSSYLIVNLKTQKDYALCICHEECFVTDKKGTTKPIKIIKFAKKGDNPQTEFLWWSPSPLNPSDVYTGFTPTYTNDIAELIHKGLEYKLKA
jgi:hypothetical protein